MVGEVLSACLHVDPHYLCGGECAGLRPSFRTNGTKKEIRYIVADCPCVSKEKEKLLDLCFFDEEVQKEFCNYSQSDAIQRVGLLRYPAKRLVEQPRPQLAKLAFVTRTVKRRN